MAEPTVPPHAVDLAGAIRALAEAIAKQPGIDKERLWRDFNDIATRYESTQGDDFASITNIIAEGIGNARR